MSLSTRILFAALLVVLLGGSVLIHETVRNFAGSYKAELAEHLDDALDSLTIVLGEQAVVGDYATIQQILDERVKRPNVAMIGWTDSRGKTLVARDQEVAIEVPGWFVDWVGYPHFNAERKLEIGGQYYGSISVQLTVASTMNQIWDMFVRQLQIILLFGALSFTLAAILLKIGLRPLQRLKDGADRFGQGDYSVRLAPTGTPDMLPTIHAFNDMADKIEGLLDSLRKFSRALEQSANVVVIADLAGSIEYVNPMFCEVTGYTLDEVIGQNPRILKSGETPAEEYRKMWETITAGDIWRGEFHNRRKDGSLFWESASIAPIRNEKGDITHFVAVKEDITRRKEGEEQMKRLNETLEQRVHEEVARNREKDHMLIRQSRLAAMGEMIGNIAHQWRQPLNALGLLLANIKDAHDYHELDEAYLNESVIKGRLYIDKMSTTIDDFRNFFKPNREKMPFSLVSTIRDALSVVDASLNSSNIVVLLNVEQDATTLGFSNEYAQVVLNILGNAKDAIRDRRIQNGRIELSVSRDETAACVAIRDNGGGIPDEILEKIFDPYFTTRASGTGIGLYMSKMIIENNMNGRIEVRNAEEGAEFRIITPLCPDARVAPPGLKVEE
ncbi:MAG: PAS domain S-box protein [Betaproteobacteria bacterium]|nr:PAS domain S-box protein [Betaproteobacteria bacterium]